MASNWQDEVAIWALEDPEQITLIRARVTRALQLLLLIFATTRIRLGISVTGATMTINVAREGRLFSLGASEWSVLLVGVTLCGFLTLFF